MADLTITDANVRAGSQVRTVTAGESITPFMPLYKKTSDSKYYMAINNNTAETAKAAVIALTNADADDNVVVQDTGTCEPGATLVQGETYLVSDTAGKIQPIGDITTGQYVTELGKATSTTVLDIDINATGVTHA